MTAGDAVVARIIQFGVGEDDLGDGPSGLSRAVWMEI